ncbi:hypothetical protein BBK36DRAFT_1170299 [Trichoderma citrinoviride]|uniref:N-acetyltransferase domain-containing protein n=1 Tax=Trichoderma citrinoviride TaxID=58853 RepID=A0A2T4B5U9_9HYPO|nr:hypothetical protein BBK36DRAFT_1170299 [Trichoderma citrinoviride]PTB64609.1 hypothetical protein BBK36DRAFT_1170299 [Trichoderma citrinoviride]
MAFIICVPSEADAPAISTVHLRAMDENLLTHAQFPSPEGLRFFHGWLARDTVGHLADGDENKGVLVAREEEEGRVVSFVKWLVHRPAAAAAGHDDEETKKDGGEEEWPEVARAEYLDPYAELTGRVRDGVLGKGAAYYRDFAGRGAASLLLRKVQDLAAAEGLPVVLEATMNAIGFYEKMGFEVRDELSMMLPARGASEPTEFYEERCMGVVIG